jgi:hypothetical protein
MFVFAEEAGDFAFERGEGRSLYFILCSLRMPTCETGAALMDLRRNMRLRGLPVGNQFHATSDGWPIRREVFDTLARFPFDIDVTVLAKPKARHRTRTNEATFYKYAWYFHAKYLFKRVFPNHRDILISAAALETKRGKAAFKNAFNEAVQQLAMHPHFAIDFPPSISDPCLQAADYCAWALQRKWEFNDRSMYDRIAPKIRSEFDLWRFSGAHILFSSTLPAQILTTLRRGSALGHLSSGKGRTNQERI